MKIKSFLVLGLLLLNLFNSVITLQAGEGDFNGVNPAKSWKDIKNHNPCYTQKFTADPGVMEYNGRVYVYGTNDGYLQGNKPAKNEYGRINQVNMMSSADLVNWADHGSINVAGGNGAAKWAANSWAPTAGHKTVNGKEQFFLYFANNASGIGVLVADSPTGPWKDPIGKALISRQTPNCNVEWLFDPAVLVDTDGTGYLYFGGGVPSGKQANPQTIRAAKLGGDMISLAGQAVNIDAPWSFEDSGINKVGNSYLYSYCTNWSGGPYGNAKIAYMSSSNPLGPFTYVGTCLNNPGDFFQTVGNNHHTIIEFKNKYYIFYHAEWLNKAAYGEMLGYRTTHVDVMPLNGEKFGDAKGTLTGVEQVGEVDPYTENNANTFAWQGGIQINGNGDTNPVYNKGAWTGVAGVNFSKGAKSVTIMGGSKSGATIRISSESPSGPVIGYVSIPNTGDNNKFQEATAEVTVTGKQNIFFTASGDCGLKSYKFS